MNNRPNKGGLILYSAMSGSGTIGWDYACDLSMVDTIIEGPYGNNFVIVKVEMDYEEYQRYDHLLTSSDHDSVNLALTILIDKQNAK